MNLFRVSIGITLFLLSCANVFGWSHLNIQSFVVQPGNGQPVSVVSGRYDFYELPAQSGGFLTVGFEADGVEIEASVIDSHGHLYGRLTANEELPLHQQMFALAPSEEMISIAIHAEPRSASACYTIRVQQSEPDEGKLLQLATQEAHAGAVRAATNSNELERNYITLLRARAIWEVTGQETNDATTTRAIVENLYRQGRLQEAIEETQHEAETWRLLNEPRAFAYAKLREGELQVQRADKESALSLLNGALASLKEQDDIRGQALAHQLLGSLYFGDGAQKEAMQEFQNSLALRQQIGDALGEAQSFSGIAASYSEMGEVDLAIENYTKAVPVLRRSNDKDGFGITLNNLGMLLKSTGQYQQALKYMMEAVIVLKDSGPRSLGIRMNNIGLIYHEMGDLEKAVSYYKEALKLKRRAGDRNGIAATLNNLGKVSVDRKRYNDALHYYNEALVLIRQSGFRYGEATLLQNIGEVYVETSSAKAGEFFEQARKIWKELGSRSGVASADSSIGSFLLKQNQPVEAISKLESARSLRQQIQDRSGEANTLLLLAKAYRKAGQSEQAMAAIEEALNINEQIRSDVMVPSLRATFAASRRASEEFYIQLLYEMGKRGQVVDSAERAFSVSEKSRARSFLELLSQNSFDDDQAAPELIRKERDLLRKLDTKLKARVDLLSENSNPGAIDQIESEMNALTTEVQQVEAEIAERESRYSSLVHPSVLKVSEIQEQLLGPDALLLEFFCGDEASYVWIVTSTSIHMYRLPAANTLRSVASTLYKSIAGLTPGEAVGVASRPAVQTDGSIFEEQSAILSRMLFRSIAAELEKKRQILIVPDEPLQYVPFAALPVPEHLDALIVNHEVTMLPSASTLALLRKQIEPQETQTMSVAVFADPVYEREDPRNVAHNVAAKVQTSAFSRLPFSRWEAESILSLIPEANRFGALGFEANRANLESERLQQYRIIHLAVHGLIDSANPELSAIILSQYRPDGSRDNGFLTAPEILRLRLHAYLVALSGCGTSLGRNIRGEGLLGLVRSFMYAGSSRVIATLWQVEDSAAAELMTRFYRILLSKPSISASSALRLAQLEIRNQRRWSSPFYWAGFTIHGEYQ